MAQSEAPLDGAPHGTVFFAAMPALKLYFAQFYDIEE